MFIFEAVAPLKILATDKRASLLLPVHQRCRRKKKRRLKLVTASPDRLLFHSCLRRSLPTVEGGQETAQICSRRRPGDNGHKTFFHRHRQNSAK
jgi:hypothetical protein